jgi:NAD(P)-dependent dehydrogenase (short-subunit alcohol dehydrogenase family)
MVPGAGATGSRVAQQEVSVFDVQGKKYVVTGTASGIGLAVANQLLRDGASVISLDRNPTSAEVEQHITVDLADQASIDGAVAEIDGTVDGLINVAGIPGTAPSELVLRVNFLGMRHLTESLLERIARGGSVVVVSSTAGYFWRGRLPVIRELLETTSIEEGAKWFAANPQEGDTYIFSKEAATVYAQLNGLRYAGLGLRINAITPGPVETPILVDFEATMGKESLDGVRQLVGRHATPDDVARAIIYLASPAAEFVNGHALDVDGGLTGAMNTGLVPIPE